tara:strand:+ start:11654 stop:12766 length:1113 start_codon:yes stop_codon:yes gene_type:complete
MLTPKIDFCDLRLSASSELKVWKKAKKLVQENGFILGQELKQFEIEFANYCSTDFAIGVGSGCDSLLWVMEGLGIGKGDEVITVANTYIGSVLPIIRAGAKPVLVDCNPNTQQIDIDQVKDAISPRTTAVLAVHLYGRLAQMNDLKEITEKNGLVLLEDAAQAHGAYYRGKRAGSIGKAAGFSFYPAKNLGAWGDGGAITTSDTLLANKINSIRNYGQIKKYHHQNMGWNSRLDTFQAIVLSEKLKQLDKNNKKRRQVAKWYYEFLKDLPIKLYKEDSLNEAVHHLFVITIDNRNKIQKDLTSHSIATGIHYPVPIHKHECFAQKLFAKGKSFPHSEKQADQLLSLPMHPKLTKKDTLRVASALKKILGI